MPSVTSVPTAKSDTSSEGCQEVNLPLYEPKSKDSTVTNESERRWNDAWISSQAKAILPPKPDVGYHKQYAPGPIGHKSSDPSIASALPALARQHAAKLASVSAASPAVLASAYSTTNTKVAPAAHIVTSSPSPSMSAATQLATLGVGVGPGINPNISSPSSTQGANGPQNNPPIINTGNNGP